MEKSVDPIKMAQREYYREWRKRNPEKVAEINRRYWAKKAERALTEQKGANDETKPS